ncbi:MAG: hypothetical protein ACHQAV_03195 [Solirubrobacterales bacterium]
MQAMNGSIASGGRRRLIGCAVAVVALSAMMMPSLASAKPPPITKTYLALGDSLAFGYSTQLYHEYETKGDPAQGFEAGYANAYLAQIKGKALGIQLTNNGCPGETTESFIGTKNPAIIPTLNSVLTGKIPLPVKGESPCGYQEAWNAFHKNGTGGPLHHPYVGESQLENAIKTIKEDSENGKPVENITLNIGANDELHSLGKVEAEAKAAVVKKVKEHAEAECLALAGGNPVVAAIICASEVEPVHFPGVTVEQYLENKYATEHGFELNAEGEKIGKELITAALPELFGQINSNLSGILLAIRKAGSLGFGGVDYNGRITFQGGYNPFGKQFDKAFEGVAFAIAANAPFAPAKPYAVDSGRCAEHAETQAAEEAAIGGGCQAAALQIGFNGIAALLNGYEYENAHNAFGACVTDPEVKFNPQAPKKPTLEPERLKAWTGMTNATITEGKPNGPDIHPTPAGYKQLSSEMYQEAKRCHKENEEHPLTGPYGF